MSFIMRLTTRHIEPPLISNKVYSKVPALGAFAHSEASPNGSRKFRSRQICKLVRYALRFSSGFWRVIRDQRFVWQPIRIRADLQLSGARYGKTLTLQVFDSLAELVRVNFKSPD